MAHDEFYAAVYGIIKDSSGKYLLQRRANTGFNDGILQFPSGHLEGEETYFQALKREIKEEIGINIKEDDVKLRHVLHRICSGGRVYYDIFLEIEKYSGDIANCEPEKCSELDFFDIAHPDVTFYNRDMLKHIDNGIYLSEIIM